jgi:WbqC-like protein family
MHPEYRQCADEPFIPGLASIDLLFNCGPQSRAILMSSAAAGKLRAAA